MKNSGSSDDPPPRMKQELDLTVEGYFGLTSGIVWWMDRDTVVFWCDEQLSQGSRNGVRVDLGTAGGMIDCVVEVTGRISRSQAGVTDGYVHRANYWLKLPNERERLHNRLARINPRAFGKSTNQFPAVGGDTGPKSFPTHSGPSQVRHLGVVRQGAKRANTGGIQPMSNTAGGVQGRAWRRGGMCKEAPKADRPARGKASRSAQQTGPMPRRTSRAQMLVSAARLKKRADPSAAGPRPSVFHAPPSAERRAATVAAPGRPNGGPVSSKGGASTGADPPDNGSSPPRSALRYHGSSVLMRQRARQELRARSSRTPAPVTPAVDRPRVAVKIRTPADPGVALLRATIKLGPRPSVLLQCDDRRQMQKAVRVDGHRAVLRLAPLFDCAEGTELDVFFKLPDNTFTQFNATVTAATPGRTIITAPYLDDGVVEALRLAMQS